MGGLVALPTGWISVSTVRLFVTMNVLSPLFPLPGIGLGGVTTMGSHQMPFSMVFGFVFFLI